MKHSHKTITKSRYTVEAILKIEMNLQRQILLSYNKDNKTIDNI